MQERLGIRLSLAPSRPQSAPAGPGASTAASGLAHPLEQGIVPYVPNKSVVAVRREAPQRYAPRFTYNESIVRFLMEIEGARQVVNAIPLKAGIESALRRTARISSAHFSTKIEQNPLSQNSVGAIDDDTDRSQSHAAQEVRNYLRALTYIHDEAAKVRLNKALVQRLHATIDVRHTPGRRHVLSPFRTMQNRVYDDVTGNIEYIPPEAHDVPTLVENLMIWLNGPAKSLPQPIVAGIAQYQLVTIHPWMDGNGRTSSHSERYCCGDTVMISRASSPLKSSTIGIYRYITPRCRGIPPQLLLWPERSRPHPLAPVLPSEHVSSIH